MNARGAVAASLAAVIAAATPVHAQRGLRRITTTGPEIFQFTPYVGYMVIGDLLRDPGGFSLSGAGSAVYGAQLGLRLTRDVSLVGNVAYSSSDLKEGGPFSSGVVVGSAGVWMYDGALQFALRMPGPRRAMPVVPFVQVGAGAMHYDIRNSDIPDTRETNFAWNAGIGLDVHMAPEVGLRLMAKDYIGRFSFRDPTGLEVIGPVAQDWALTAGLRIGF
jgi:hypothetical protein